MAVCTQAEYSIQILFLIYLQDLYIINQEDSHKECINYMVTYFKMLSLELFKLHLKVKYTTTYHFNHLNLLIKNQLLKATMWNIFKEVFHIQLSKKLRLLIISKSLMKLESTQTLITQLMFQYHMKSIMKFLLTNLTMSHMKSELKTQYQPLMKSKQLTHNHTTSKSQLINLIMSKDSYQSQLKELSKQMFLTELMLINHIQLKS